MSLLAWYPLSKNAYLNYGIDGIDLSINGTVALNGVGNFGGSTRFIGNPSNYLYRNGFKLEKNFTWCCWFKINETNSYTYQFILSEGRDMDQVGINIFYRNSDGYLVIQVGSGDSAYAKNISTITTGQWYHVALVVTDSNIIIYLNGKIANESGIYCKPDYTQSSDKFVIGKMSFNYTNTDSYFPLSADINDVRIYDNALSYKEISEIAKGLVLHYPMNQMDKPYSNLVDASNPYSQVGGSYATIVKKHQNDAYTGELVYTAYQTLIDPSNYSGNYFIIWYDTNYSLLKTNTKYYMQIWVKVSTACNVWLSICNTNSSNAVIARQQINISKINTWVKVSASATSSSVTPTESTKFRIDTDGCYSANFAMQTKHPLVVECDSDTLDIAFCPDYESESWSNHTNIIEYDTSGFGNNGYSVNATAPYCYYGEMGACYNFNSEQKTIYVNNPIVNTFPFSISFWMYYDTNLTLYGYPCILTGRTVMGEGIACFVSNGAIRFDAGGQKTFSVSTHLDKWTHVVLVKTLTTSSIYVDGNLIGSSETTALTSTSSNLTIGSSSVNWSFTGTDFFRGRIKDFRMYATALSADDIKTMYKARQFITDNSVLTYGEIINM